MKKCIVIGGGFAGLSAAAFLSSQNYHVELIESSPKLGGRAYSITDEETGCIIDNGQHIMMGCYTDTLKFIRLINAEENFFIQKNLSVNFLKENLETIKLEAGNFLYPFNLAAGLLNYKALTLKDRLILFGLFIKIPLIPEKDLSRLTVYNWLKQENQNERIRSAFWDILATGALNTDIKKASASVFLSILKQMLFKGNNAAAIIVPTKGLSESYCSNAVKYICDRGGKISEGETVTQINKKGDKVVEIVTSKRALKDFDILISSIPQYSLKKLFPEFEMNELEYSPILSFHIWVKNNPLEKGFYGLINSPLHWIFNHGTHLTLVISSAVDHINKNKDELFDLVLNELKKFTGLTAEEIIKFRIIKEKRATFIPSNEINGKRPDTHTEFKNFFLAGDWINTDLPSTIESAVKSGRMAADVVVSEN
jgi:hydroxysqualene dehydroxylase